MTNTLKKLAENPHYKMSDDEIKDLQALLAEEANSQKEYDPEFSPKKVNKNRVQKQKVVIDKHDQIEEQDDNK